MVTTKANGNGDRFLAYNWKWVMSALFGFIALVAAGAAEARSLREQVDKCTRDSILLYRINERTIRIEARQKILEEQTKALINHIGGD